MNRLSKRWQFLYSVFAQRFVFIFVLLANGWSVQASPAIGETVEFSYRLVDLNKILLPLTAILLLPIGLVLWLRQAALQAKASDPTAAWFGYFRSLGWIVNGMWLCWLVANSTLNVWQWINLVIGSELSLSIKIAINLTVFLLPPAVVFVICYALSHPVYARVRGMSWTQRDLIWQAVLSQTVSFLPIVLGMSGIVAIATGNFRLGVVSIAMAVGCFVVLMPLLVKAQDMTPHALTVGKLRDRIFELAKIAGVKLQQVYVIPANKGRLANAFASQGNNILLTDYLLEQLNQQEVDAIVGHELGHLKHNHPAKLGRTLILAIAIFTAISISLGGGIYIFIAVLLGYLTFYFVSQRFEHTADAESVAIAGNAEAMITGLVKLTRLNFMPLDWGKVQQRMTTHPSTLNRANAIASRANISSQRLQEIINTVDSDQEKYTLPSAITNNEDRVFSTTFKTSCLVRNMWIGVGVITITPAIFAQLAHLVNVSTLTAFVYLLGLVATVGLSLITTNFTSVWGYADLQKKLRLKLQRQGINSKDGIFVSFSPASSPRVYEGFTDWDVGFLFITQSCLCYVGEQTRFTLSPEQITTIKLSAAGVSWWKNQSIYLTWHDRDRNATDTFNLRPANGNSLTQSNQAARLLHQKLQAWWKNPSNFAKELPNRLNQIGTPDIGTVTSVSPRQAVSPKQLIGYLDLCILVAIGVSVIVGLPVIASCYVILVTILTIIFQIIPLWRYREPKSSSEQVLIS